MKMRFDFQKIKIDLDHYSLRPEGGDEQFMEPRLIKLLHVLYENANEVVTKDVIMKSAWGDVMVNEESISRAVFDLRKDLDKRFSNPPTIQSIRKVGYRLVVKVSPLKSKHILVRALTYLGYVVAALFFLGILIRAIHY
jgi:DNA-binding winged helix-turn-helix (wHTH) protein